MWSCPAINSAGQDRTSQETYYGDIETMNTKQLTSDNGKTHSQSQAMTSSGPPSPAKIFTIGTNEKTAEEFFGLIMDAGVQRIVDIRRRNNGQIQGFTKMTHLPYFLREIAEIDYVHMPDIAPTNDLLDAWRNGDINWRQYVARFTPTLRKHKPETLFEPSSLDGICLLCTEPTTEHCHRRLVAEHLCKQSDESVEIVHLVK
jgi:uncharacterized protein (DUF488 family)